MKTMLYVVFRLVLFACIISAAGCAGTGTLVPATSALIVDGRAVNIAEGVRVEVTGDTWPGNPGIYSEVTPLEITIENINGPELRVAYGLFSLIDEKGKRYFVLPPYTIEGNIGEETIYSDFTCEGFGVASHYSCFYPKMLPYEGVFEYDPDYFNHYYGCLNDVELPTKEMIDKALPEGVLWKNAKISGFLYFEKISESEKYRLKMVLIDMSDGSHIGEIDIPLMLKK